MTASSPPPAWRLPEGVNASLWEYAHTPRLADEEDDYFAGHPLFLADVRALDARFIEPGRLIDLGCGTGRLALRFARRGFPVVAVDLSRAMLQTVNAKAAADTLKLSLVQANLCRLECLPAASFDYALSMFSTLGMIRGTEARRRALAETFRILRPGGRLALHAHNLWLNLRDPQGRFWLLGQCLRWLLRRPDLGDRRMTYRGIPGMEVHLYRWPELRAELTGAGFQIDEVLPIDRALARPISAPWLLHAWRAGGWFVFAHRPRAMP
ncbi:MAG TPA: class I SAM-dependent methyltransferase [Isosphaeraceae bacterium]|jgi:SAM-dependent methyltransferase|nr:class I SAM-dependent methyltransferase [Isosphaeraceae bacterium]